MSVLGKPVIKNKTIEILSYLGTQHTVCLITVCFGMVTAITIVLYFGRGGDWSHW